MSLSPGASSSGSDNESREFKAPKQTAPEVSSNSTESSRGRNTRPKTSRNGSSIIIPRTASAIQEDEQDYPPGDAGAMSPRRGSEETDVMEEATRCAVREQARQLQLSLLEIAESIELVKADHDKLEKQNLALQDYIGGLTRSMSKGAGPKGSKGSSK